ncbi:MAG: glycoside hydrolase family 2 protein [Bacteroidales bacterium]|nr:glycoside hydrolase family 2 protein [Bacteroidales bacterium]
MTKANKLNNCTYFSRILFVLLIQCIATFTHAQSPANQILTNNWKLTNPETGRTYPMQLPAEVHRVLFENDLIPDPYFGNNEIDLQWIGMQEWIFSCDFIPDSNLFNSEQIELQFPGLDTYCTIYLNDRLLLQSDNAFRSWSIPVKRLLREGNNTLKLRFLPIDSIQDSAAKQYPFSFPESRCFSRKAPYQSGWDWGPTYKTMGITKAIKLLGWNNAVLRNLTIRQNSIETNEASICFVGEIESAHKQEVTIKISNDTSQPIHQQIILESGLNHFEIPYKISNPQLWWPNDLGEQHLYRFNVSMIQDDEEIDKQRVKTGLRSIKLIQKPDSIGTSFYFEVNGKPVFMKGTNYVPQDNFVTTITPARTRKLLADAAAVHMNMIRVWGGGIYPDDDFYQVCDSLGLLVWQDFMFAGTMYPFDSAFIANVEVEAREQIQRISSHPSLALWCGNNEVSEAFHNWGWQKSLKWTANDSIRIWKGYQQIFEDLLPNLVNEYDSGRPYWPSSPSVGWGRAESMTRGDSHYWGVWWGEQAFSKYEEKVGRFMSEYGFQSMPEMSTISKFTNPVKLTLHDTLLQSHQKHKRGKYLIDKYMADEFPVPEKLEDYVYMSQLVQASGMVRAIEAHRRAMPYCMGTLYWQLNDSWPAISWSSIDYYGNRKALHYHLNEVFAPVLISFEPDHDSVNIVVVSDLWRDIDCKMIVKLSTFSGEVLDSVGQNIRIRSTSSHKVLAWPTHFNHSRFDEKNCIIRVELIENEMVIADKNYYFVEEKDLNLSKEKPKIDTEKAGDSIILTLSSGSLIKDVFLQSNDTEGFFRENYFDLIPGTRRKISFKPSGKIAAGDLIFKTTTLNDIVN